MLDGLISCTFLRFKILGANIRDCHDIKLGFNCVFLEFSAKYPREFEGKKTTATPQEIAGLTRANYVRRGGILGWVITLKFP